MPKKVVKKVSRPVPEIKPKQNSSVNLTELFGSFRFQKWFVLAFSLLLYANTLDLNYALDDTLMITENTFTKKGVHGIKDIFTNDAFVGFLGKNNLLPGGRYRPLSQVMFAVEYQFFGFNPFIGHLINVILYGLLCMLLFTVLLKVFDRYRSEIWFLYFPLFATLLFAAHPLHTEVVANIKGRDEIMCLLASLGALYFSLKYIDNKKIYNLLLSFFILFLGILSKESAITFIAAIPLCIYFYKKASFKDYSMVVIPLLLAFFLSFALRTAFIGLRVKYTDTELLNNPFLFATFSEKYATIMLTWLKYLWLTFVPYTLTHDYYPKQIPIIGWSDPRAILTFLLFAALAVFAIIKLPKKNIYVFGVAFFIITFSISSNLIFNIGTFMNERFLFTPLLGFAIIASYFLNKSLSKFFKNNFNIILTVFLLIMVAYSLKTFTRNRVWMDDLTLFTTDVKVSTNSNKCNTSAGGKLLEKADSTKNEIEKNAYINKAIGYLNKANEIYPQNQNSWLLLGNAYAKIGAYADSRKCYDYCIKLQPNNEKALNNILYVAQKSYNEKQYRESLITYNYLLKSKPNETEYIYYKGLTYRGLNIFDSAIYFLNKAIELKPNYADAYSRLGEIYGQNLNQLDQAFVYLMKAVELDPKNESALENIGIIYGIKKKFKESIEYFNKALLLEPNKPAIYENIGNTYNMMGDKQKAQEYFARAQAVKAKK
jgi:tetratricopeptide (TPR) repeat protein